MKRRSPPPQPLLGIVLAGTGHRPDKLGGYSDEVFRRLVRLAKTRLEVIKPQVVISGMALGWDQALAVAALDMKIITHAYVPFQGQEKMWPLESRLRYFEILKQVNQVEYICDGGYAGWKMSKRNEAMVDSCHLVLALWNGSPGGTANCMAYARLRGKSILNAWSDWQAMTASSGQEHPL
jgi:uncharacterized phage-like protein YoqJ